MDGNFTINIDKGHGKEVQCVYGNNTRKFMVERTGTYLRELVYIRVYWLALEDADSH